MTLQRTLAPVLSAFVITTLLILLMHRLIYFDKPRLEQANQAPALSFSDVIEEQPPIITPPDRKEFTQVKELPITDKDFIIEPNIIDNEGGLVLPIKFKPSVVGNPDSNQLILLMGYPPEYPPAALSREQQGYVVVVFKVNQDGSTFDAYVSESEPRGVFDRSALKAIAKFKYRPKMVNGVAQVAHNQRYLFRYDLEQ